jgi:hypothetical protein
LKASLKLGIVNEPDFGFGALFLIIEKGLQMNKIAPYVFMFFGFFYGFSAVAAEQGALVDQRLVGLWKGMREVGNGCQFLAWQSKFTSDARFEITFFADREMKNVIQTERGAWAASDGKNMLKTEGVDKPEVYAYTVLNADSIKYVNTVRDTSADCQADYEFIEYRVKG